MIRQSVLVVTELNISNISEIRRGVGKNCVVEFGLGSVCSVQMLVTPLPGDFNEQPMAKRLIR